MRNFHRYASAAMGITVTLHLLREFALDRYSGPRWFSWAVRDSIAVAVVCLRHRGLLAGGDQQAQQYIAVLTAEWFDWLPIMVDPMASNFLNESTLSDRFSPCWCSCTSVFRWPCCWACFIHIKRVTAARSNPAKGLVAGTLLALLAISLWQPALSRRRPTRTWRLPRSGWTGYSSILTH